MRTLGVCLLMLAMAPLGFAQAPKAAASKIISVTVYPGTALVSREVSVPEGAGTMEILVSPLPEQTESSSLYATGGEGLRVLSTRYRATAVAEDTREEVRKLDAQIKTNQLNQQKLESELKTLEQNLALLTKMEVFTNATLATLSEKGQLNSAGTLELANFVLETRGKMAKEQLTLAQSIEASKVDLSLLQRQRSEKAAGSSRTERDAIITLDKGNAAPGKIQLNYLVNNVAWRPQYKIRSGKDKEPVTVEYLAMLTQMTGEDWTGVEIKLSTAQPMLNAAPPDLKVLDVAAVPLGPTGPGGQNGMPPGAYFPGGKVADEQLKQLTDQSRQQRAAAQMNYNNLKTEDGSRLANSAAALDSFRELLTPKDALTRDTSSRVEDGPSVTYTLKGRVSLPSRSDEQVVEITRLELTPEFYYKAIPVLSPHVYRQATLVNKSEYVLLPGESTMYMGTDFVGRLQLPLVAIGKQFTVGFGVDPQIQVTRQLVDRTRTTQGGNQLIKFDYRIMVQSFKSTPVTLQVWDRVPYADGNAIAVTMMTQKPELSKDPVYVRDELPKNLLRWDVNVQPGQNTDKPLVIDYTYRLEMALNVSIGSFQSR
ncbi:DUF4139 domain-containing protein [Tuwongella immobilis]|uniref:Mucoidy inhibitor MuiA family protein n=1 Tax=Tuwongella immobilis TaxID=692036 RepID=A0A6C2YL64_9BACT|nr:mucoidy inhibitor MuiA family protein [Tuwongella immobilis]VIP01845.1 Uncharacterized protein OS=Singulisphaera acidiphila (strain ATCC BAA-1392 / DSM 18658 / VKM B-2454 / MOB10) GN=Sinac_0348 PE=4 SV=1: DUF4140: DUF4139 [Tuwongella immobilis]VTR99623.1 Uncharacterized protein OS=Singulisphaera acidiphila (strain ATCC BAA-1392 / DSM 18658 / VKM B-2454 / MOB10) GN=Sinac_0348 PE=4 SV=1: DUF4140: DUF4139 [Tuwongella immobilis]